MEGAPYLRPKYKRRPGDELSQPAGTANVHVGVFADDHRHNVNGVPPGRSIDAEQDPSEPMAAASPLNQSKGVHRSCGAVHREYALQQPTPGGKDGTGVEAV